MPLDKKTYDWASFYQHCWNYYKVSHWKILQEHFASTAYFSFDINKNYSNHCMLTVKTIVTQQCWLNWSTFHSGDKKPAALWVKKVGGAGSFNFPSNRSKFSTAEIMGGQNFNFAPKFPNVGVLASSLAFSDENLEGEIAKVLPTPLPWLDCKTQCKFNLQLSQRKKHPNHGAN